MKTITVSGRSKTLNDLLKKARQTDLILESPEGEQFMLARVRDSLAFYVGESENFEEEVAATRKNKKFMKFLEKRAAKAKGRKGTPLAEVKRQMGL
jgi:hypothetical protein